MKIFLIASAAERGRRRFEEMRIKGEDVDLDQTVAEIEERDRLDTTREHSPLIMPADAVEVDTTGLTIDQVHSRIMQVVQSRLLPVDN